MDAGDATLRLAVTCGYVDTGVLRYCLLGLNTKPLARAHTSSMRTTCLLLLLVGCQTLHRAPPRHGEVGYKRHRAKELARQIIRELRTHTAEKLPPVLTDRKENCNTSRAREVVKKVQVERHSPLSPVGAAPWGTGLPRDVEVPCLVFINEEEEAQLLALKRAVSPWMPLRADPQFREAVHGDVRLMRFLRKYGSPSAAAENYLCMLGWRQEAGVDETLRVEPGASITAFTNHAVLDQYMPVDVTLCWPQAQAPGEVINIEDTPKDAEEVVLLMRLGQWDTHGLVQGLQDGEFSEKDFTQYWTQVPTFLADSLHISSLPFD